MENLSKLSRIPPPQHLQCRWGMNAFLCKFLDIFYSNTFSFSEIYDIINTERTSLNLQKGEILCILQ